MNLLQILLNFLKKSKYPKHLKIRGRKKLPSTEFKQEDKLYHGFDNSDKEDSGLIRLETIRFPDFSCNWNRFSNIEDIHFRQNSKKTDGCYSFTVLYSRYKSFATPVHDPIQSLDFPNYSHVEVRELFDGESVLFEPPKNRKKKKSRKSKRLEYRQNILNHLIIELESR